MKTRIKLPATPGTISGSTTETPEPHVGGDTGQFVWKREDLDAFPRGGRAVDTPLALRKGSQADSSRNLPPEEGRLLRAGPYGDGRWMAAPMGGKEPS
jgi:hypothetical protein